MTPFNSVTESTRWLIAVVLVLALTSLGLRSWGDVRYGDYFHRRICTVADFSHLSGCAGSGFLKVGSNLGTPAELTRSPTGTSERTYTTTVTLGRAVEEAVWVSCRECRKKLHRNSSGLKQFTKTVAEPRGENDATYKYSAGRLSRRLCWAPYSPLMPGHAQAEIFGGYIHMRATIIVTGGVIPNMNGADPLPTI